MSGSKGSVIRPMRFERQQELIRLECTINRHLTWNEMLMLGELAKEQRKNKSPTMRWNATWLAAGADIGVSAARRALRKLIDRKLVHLIPAYGYRLRVWRKLPSFNRYKR